MIEELDRRLGQLSREQAESAPVPVDWESVRARATFDRSVPVGTSKRVLAVVGGVAAVGILVVGLVVFGDGPDSDPMGGSVPTVGSVPVTTEAVVIVPTTPPTVSSTTPSEATVPAVDALTLDDVRAGQVAALRQLPGFTATAEVTQTFTPYSLDGVAQPEQSSTRTAEFTLLPDGSFWAQTSPDEWGSYDPATHTVRGAFRNPDGALQYQEMVGQADNSVPLGVLSGMFPTQLVGGMDDSTEVEDTTLDGRRVWEITTVMNYDPSICHGDGCDFEPYSQTMVQTVDQDTGLLIKESNTTTDEHGTSQVAVLRDVRPVDTMPDGFPGAFPPDAVVDRSGDPAIAISLTMDDIPAHFGIATPVPTGLDGATVTAGEMMGPSVNNDDPASGSYRTRTADVVTHDGFLTTRISIRATVAADAITDDLIIDGYVCRNGDADQDGICDSPDGRLTAGTPGSQTVTIEHGAFAGREVVVDNGNVGINVGLFDINIGAPSDAEAIAMLNSFELR